MDTHLLAYLAAVPDPRAARGRRHLLVAILAMAAAAVLAGAHSVAAIGFPYAAQVIQGHPQDLEAAHPVVANRDRLHDPYHRSAAKRRAIRVLAGRSAP